MTTQNTGIHPTNPLWRRLLKWALRAAAVTVVLGIAAYASANYWAAKTIHAEIARIRAAGGRANAARFLGAADRPRLAG